MHCPLILPLIPSQSSRKEQESTIKNLARILIALVILSLNAGCGGQSATAEARVDQVFAQWDKPDSPGCALTVIQDGEIIYKRGYGMANLEHRVPISSKTVFYIGSTSKQFTAMSILLLEEQGQLSLDDDIREYIPELPQYDHPITIRHLIHHTSGIPDYLALWQLAGRDFAAAMPEGEVLDLLTQQEPLFAPGDRFRYSNSGYFLLSLIVKRASGKSLREFAEENIFQPLGMRDTLFYDDHTMIIENRADGHFYKDGSIDVFNTSYDLVGAGGLYTTVEDLFLWDQNFYRNRLGQGEQALIDRMLTPGTLNDGTELDYAFGLGVSEYEGLRMISHGGGFIGFRAELIRFPEQGFSVAVLCNLDCIDAELLALTVADIYLFVCSKTSTPIYLG